MTVGAGTGAGAGAGPGAAAGRVVEEIATAWSVPGAAVAVTGPDGVVWQHLHGSAHPSRADPVRGDHLFPIGSISKAATAMVALHGVRDGLLSLEQPIAGVLPWVPARLHDPAITLRTLLNHTAGLVGSVDALPDERAQVAGYASGAGAGGPAAGPRPGAEFHYSNLGFILAGLAAATAFGRDLPALVQERVLGPAGMRDSVPVITAAASARLATGSQPLVDDRPWLPGDALVAAPLVETAGSDGSIAATIVDLAAFARVLLRGGRGDLGDVLDPASFELMTGLLAPAGEDVLVVPGATPPHWSRYGLGVNVESTDGGRVLTHGGGMVGYASFLLASPEAGRAVVVVTTADGDSRVAEAMARSVDALFAEQDAALHLPTRAGAAQPPPPERSAVLAPARWATAAQAGGASPEPWTVRPPALAAPALGAFTDVDGEQLEIRATGTGYQVQFDGAATPLLWTWSDRALADLPALRRFGLVFDGVAWNWGPRVFEPKPMEAVAEPPSPTGLPAVPSELLDALPGHYRSYTPWYPHFRVVRRGARLVLIAPRGVEAPADDEPLVPIAPGLLRIGSDPGAPETLRSGPVIDGRCVWVDRDGCRYSRSFTP